MRGRGSVSGLDRRNGGGKREPAERMTLKGEDRSLKSKNKRVIWKKLPRNMRYSITALVMFIFVIMLCTNVLRRSLVENTNRMGLTLVENYSTAEESNMRACESILTISVNYIKEREGDDISVEELKEGLYPFMNGLTELYGGENVQIYGRAMGRKCSPIILRLKLWRIMMSRRETIIRERWLQRGIFIYLLPILM